MDAGSLHKHIESSTRTRIYTGVADDDPSKTPSYRNDGAVKAELYREELDYNGDGIVTLMEELDGANAAKEHANSIVEETKYVDPLPSQKDDEAQENDNFLPQATILSMKEDRRRSFNPFSSRYASAPIPRQNRHALVEEAKPVRDNANAIIMILLIAILIIAVAIFGVVVAGDYRKSHNTSQTRSYSSESASTEKDEEETKTFDYNFDSIIGRWKTDGDSGSCVTINEKSKLSWMQDCSDRTSDSFSGEASIIGGQDAIDELGITRGRAARTAGLNVGDLDINQTFAIIVKPDKYTINGGEAAQKPSEIRLLLVETNDDEIRVYNYLFAELGIYSRDKDNSF